MLYFIIAVEIYSILTYFYYSTNHHHTVGIEKGLHQALPRNGRQQSLQSTSTIHRPINHRAFPSFVLNAQVKKIRLSQQSLIAMLISIITKQRSRSHQNMIHTVQVKMKKQHLNTRKRTILNLISPQSIPPIKIETSALHQYQNTVQTDHPGI